MYDLLSFREEMKNLVEKDQRQKSVQVVGKTIDDALVQASIELGIVKALIEFEVLDKGKKTFFGNDRECVIIAYPMQRKKRKDGTFMEIGDEEDSNFFEEEKATPQPGDFVVRLATDGAYLKVYPPQNGGPPVELEQIHNRLQEKAISDYKKALIKEVLQKGDGIYVKIGDFIHNPMSDTMMTIQQTPDEMEARITLSEPGPGGTDLTVEDVKSFLANNGMNYGFNEENLKTIEEHPFYGEPILVVQGDEPKDGADARIIYNFEVDSSHVNIRERTDGSMNFKELNLIQNVVDGQPLAKKIPPEAGRDGRTIKGRYLPAKDGKDVEIGLGKNVSITDNGRTVVASKNGQVMLVRGKITVETVMVIPGDVDGKTGNVNALGAVLVKGSVEDGFSVTAQGNVEILGVVGKANISAGGDIIVKKGVKGGGESTDYGYISAGRSVWASFLENAKIDAGEWVVVSDGIINCQIDSQKKVLCQGKRAQIVGGQIRAAEEIHAVILGSNGGTETILEVGYDPKTKEELVDLENQKKSMESELDDVDKNIQGLIKQKKIRRKKLSPEKEKLILDLRDRHNDLVQKIKKVQEDIQTREDYLASLKNTGKISVAKTINPGVILQIREISEKITRPHDKPTTYTLVGGIIRAGEYEAISENIDRR
ncbi:MAG: FapA family protein [Spirochaetaceae bacterium]|jgi:uncharacterized protein (DUF342 family)|nr:FapA family protein [Spirochaetaceae bacterium]